MHAQVKLSPSIVVCAPVMPEFDRQSGERRVWHLLQILREWGWNTTFVSSRGSTEDRYARLLRNSGVVTYVAPTAEHMHSVIRSTRFDVALCVFWYVAEEYIPLFRRVSPHTVVLVDSVDLHFVRHARRMAQQLRDRRQSPGLQPSGGEGEEMWRELSAYAAADGVLTVSEKEATLVNELLLDPTLAHAVPDGEDFARSSVPVSERQGILFLGNFQHPPNEEALAYLCDEVLPRVDPALLEVHPVRVVGNAMNERIRGYARSLPSVRMVGWVPSVLPYLESARMVVAPLLHGAGTKRKLIQALMVGTPTITTSVGAEGLGVRDGEQVLLASSPEQFATAIERLATDTELWLHLAANGEAHMRRYHSLESTRRHLQDLLQKVSSPAWTVSKSPAIWNVTAASTLPLATATFSC